MAAGFLLPAISPIFPIPKSMQVLSLSAVPGLRCHRPGTTRVSLTDNHYFTIRRISPSIAPTAKPRRIPIPLHFGNFSLQTLTGQVLQVDDHAAGGPVIIGDRLWFFGGISASGPLKDVHYVDSPTFQFTRPDTTGTSPVAGAYPLMGSCQNEIIIWAGVPGSSRASIHMLDTETLVSDNIQTKYIYRLGSRGRVVHGVLYIFGASLEMTLMTINVLAMGASIFAFETVGSGSKGRLFVFPACSASGCAMQSSSGR
jgi:hypothetical protein